MSTPLRTEDKSPPIDHFSHCHAGILNQLGRLSDLPALLAPAQLARKTAEQTLAFFAKGMFEHHSEEERELFPAVLASAHSAEQEGVRRLCEQLTLDHRALESLWQSLEPALRKVARGQEASLNDITLQELVSRYRAHAQLEEREFLPLAQTILGRNGNHMAALGLSLHLRHVPQVVSYF